ncbi:hypothetical protein MtrunA17_Chr6g0460271 [Medicago truncatula]|uniref:Uncharacterized protein n=1 Tax=Medicago truncatula TaxID=3880 RepID=A0A396HDR7_MEDTR|nr:hypothetical protein MtrunA17_Chr6g0460271 [Medicago truncatula]
MRGFKKRLQEADDAKEKGDNEEMQVKRNQTLRIYLLYLVWVTLFTNKSANYVEKEEEPNKHEEEENFQQMVKVLSKLKVKMLMEEC